MVTSFSCYYCLQLPLHGKFLDKVYKFVFFSFWLVVLSQLYRDDIILHYQFSEDEEEEE